MKSNRKNYYVTTIAGLGMLLSTLDTGIINVALSYLKVHFQTTTNIAATAITGYSLALSICILPIGVLSDRIGKLKISYFGFALFGLSSLFCGLAASMPWLVFWRIFQGIGAAALQATSAALITTLVSEEQKNSAISILGVMIGLGPVLGPSLGGLLLSLNLWQFIFWINLPFALIALVCNHYLIKKVSENKVKVRIDWAGSIINAFALVSLLLGLTLLSKSNNMTISLGLILLSLLIGLVFYRYELHRDNALVAVKSLKENHRLISYLFQTIAFGFASAMVFLLPPFIFEQVYGLSAGLTGLLVLGAPAGLVIFSRVSGKLNDGHKNQRYSLLGLIIIVLALAFLAVFNRNWNYLLLTLGLFIYGIGGGYFQPANIASIMKASSLEMQGSAGALQRMVQNVAISTGSALGSTCLNHWSGNIILASRVGWLITLVVVLLSLISLGKSNK
ncbi:MFS transporter [Streptococcus sobrinus]|uniref:MFS transporter n=1 Tax=Streptococcus sobrinus TaxID=1310 RepID=UPI00031CFD3F|nr:MFS transporter [Streptococcus sobrinus]AWN19498.1 MFS transporter [Streptococcus sobrinus]